MGRRCRVPVVLRSTTPNCLRWLPVASSCRKRLRGYGMLQEMSLNFIHRVDTFQHPSCLLACVCRLHTAQKNQQKCQRQSSTHAEGAACNKMRGAARQE
jgi:hypothetical protein